MPFDDDNVLTVMFKHAATEIPPLRKRMPTLQLPDSVEKVLMRMLAKKREDRYPSLREVEQALATEIEQMYLALPVGKRPAGPQFASLSSSAMRPLTGPLRRLPLAQRLAAGLTAGLLLILVGGGLGYYVLQRQRAAANLSSEQMTQRLLAARQKALELLKQDLLNQAVELRIGALAALQETRDGGLLPEFLPMVDDRDQRVQQRAAEALGQIGRPEAVGKLLPLLDGGASTVGESAAESLDLLGDARGRQSLGKSLAGKADAVKLRAALYLAGTGDREAKKFLTTVVEKGLASDAALVEILLKLAQSGDEGARVRLLTRLQATPNRDLQIAVASALLKLSEARGRDFLQEQARKPGPEQLKAAHALASLDESVESAVFRSIVQQSQAHPSARLLAVSGLGYSGRREDLLLLEPLLARLDDPTLRQGAAAAVLRLTGADPTVLAMQDLNWASSALKGDAALRERAVAVLGDVGNADAVALLGNLLGKNNDAKVRRDAARALGASREQGALAVLRSGLADADAEVRAEAIKSLGTVGRRLIGRGVQDIGSQVGGWLAQVAQQSTGTEALLAKSTLLKLGDNSQRTAVAQGLREAEPETRRQLIEQVDRDADLLAAALRDPVVELRQLAARKLAELGDKRAVEVLKETLSAQAETPLGLQAYALLRRLNESVTAPANVGTLLDSKEPTARAAALEALVAESPQDAARALQKGARDPDRGVRVTTAELAGRLPLASARPVLKTLMRDRDADVRERAAAVLRQLEQPAPVVAPVAANENKPAADALDAGAEKLTEKAGDSAATSTVEDKNTSGKPEATDTDADATRATVAKLLKAGTLAFEKKQYSVARKSLDKAVALCAREANRVCASMAYDLSFVLAQTLDADGQTAEAMTEYQKVRSLRGGKAAQRSVVQAAMSRLEKRLARVTIVTPKKGKCVKTEFWMTPGPHTVNVGGGHMKNVTLRAQQNQEIKACP